jgi:hypothetical protein
MGSIYDEFLVPDFDPLEKKSIEDYDNLFKKAYDPTSAPLIRRDRNVNRIANNMINVDGYTVEQMYNSVDKAREFHGLEKINRR